MGKINIGGELNPIFGRIGASAHIYDYSSRLPQDKINSLLLNEMFSFDLGLRIKADGISGIKYLDDERVTIAECMSNTYKVNAMIHWDINRKHFDFNILDETVSKDGIYIEIDNPLGESTSSNLSEAQKWSKKGTLSLTAAKGITTVTMGITLSEGYNVEQQARFYLVPPIYYGFSSLEEIHNPSEVFSNKKLDKTASGKYEIKNSGDPAYFYICIPRILGIEKIEVSSSGFYVPFVQVFSDTPSDSGIDRYDCWRNPDGSMIPTGSEIIYVVK